MLRRHFLLASAAGLAARRLGLPLAAPAAKLDRIGLELYAVRKAMKADPERTLAAIREIGYTDVELLWSFKNFDRSVKQVKEALKNTGLKAPSAHMAPETILSGWEERLAEARELGHQYLVVPSLPAETNRSIAAWKIWAQRFTAAGEEARRAGIWLAFHNEPNHEKKVQGELPLEVFLKETDPKAVRFQLDVGNMLAGGGDPLAFFRRHEKRIGSFHLKDIVAGTAQDTELGKGGFDIKGFLSQVPDLGKKPCFVEQESSADEMGSAKANYEYLKGLSW
jgi:sugar phosphate isomerase/epimerase